MKIKFTKMHGAGNDYIYVNTLQYPIENPEELAIRWSRWHTGIGSDGLVLIGASDIGDFSMRIFNADGSEAMMCGNASRCIGKYLYEYGITDKKNIALETKSGIKQLTLNVNSNNTVDEVTVDMGMPTNIHWVELGEQSPYPQGIVVSMGNPHLVIFVDNISSVNLFQAGPILENHPLFPDRTNVEFAQILDNNHIRMRVWERGSGITQACGTGACATAAAAIFTKQCDRNVRVKMDGGELLMNWDINTNHMTMKGPATKVFDGEIEL